MIKAVVEASSRSEEEKGKELPPEQNTVNVVVICLPVNSLSAGLLLRDGVRLC